MNDFRQRCENLLYRLMNSVVEAKFVEELLPARWRHVLARILTTLAKRRAIAAIQSCPALRTNDVDSVEVLQKIRREQLEQLRAE